MCPFVTILCVCCCMFFFEIVLHYRHLFEVILHLFLDVTLFCVHFTFLLLFRFNNKYVKTVNVNAMFRLRQWLTFNQLT